MFIQDLQQFLSLDEIISFSVQRSKVLTITAWKNNLYIRCSLCIFVYVSSLQEWQEVKVP